MATYFALAGEARSLKDMTPPLVMVVVMMAMVLNNLASDCPSYEKNGEQFRSVREEGQALV
jgi:hypothetical protein